MIYVVGEALVEFRSGVPPVVALSGDALNVSVRLAAKGLSVELVTALGSDPLAQWIQAVAERHGIRMNALTVADQTGIYVISHDSSGDRGFHYWRDQSPMRSLEPSLAERVNLDPNDILVVSGITLALSDSAAEFVQALCSNAHAVGARVVFDPNVRMSLWASRGGIAEARYACEEIIRLSDLILPSEEDVRLLWGDEPLWDVLSTFPDSVSCIVKCGAAGARVMRDADHGPLGRVRAPRVDAIDPTGAGDAFTAAVVARLGRMNLLEATAEATREASRSTLEGGGLGLLGLIGTADDPTYLLENRGFR